MLYTFGMKLRIFVSTIHNGSMKSIDKTDHETVSRNRVRFLRDNGVSPELTALVRLTYDGDTYTRYTSIGDENMGNGITKESTIVADALTVSEPGQALLLPLADCIGAVVHDTTQNVLMVSHLGRHNLEQHGGTQCIEYLVAHYGTDPKDITVWLSPAAGLAHYPLFAFDGRSLHEVAFEQIAAAGVPQDSIEVSPIDSAGDLDYFSHSQFLKGNRKTDGRFAIAAVLS